MQNRVMPVRRRHVSFALGLTLFSAAILVPSKGQDGEPLTYDGAILPIFKSHCLDCHGPDNPDADLDLSSEAGMRKGGFSGPLWISGKSSESLLVQKLLGKGRGKQMPLGYAPLSDQKIDIVKRWIDSGASFDKSGIQTHWAYTRIARPEIPKSTEANPVDAFVGAALKHENLTFSPEASKEILARRAYLDIIGLPPTVKQLDTFLSDKSAKAYENLVDKLLASPHYGERQARIWLDLARYADTNGFEKDGTRSAYAFRDYVIDSFNQNKPFDQFTIEQIAGDLLPKATRDQVVATGFHRNTMLNLEGGVDQAEAYFDVLVDRVNTTGSVWLGSTITCARCHDHKFDPTTQKDFYQLLAYFNNSVVTPRGDASVSEEKWIEPIIEAPTDAQKQAIADLAQRQDQVKARIADRANRLQSQLAVWADQVATGSGWQPASLISATSMKGANATLNNGAVLISGPNPDHDTLTVNLKTAADTKVLRLTTIPHNSNPVGGAGRAGSGNFIVSGVSIVANGKPVALDSVRADFVQSSFDPNLLVKGPNDMGWAVHPEGKKSHSLGLLLQRSIPAGASVTVTIRCAAAQWPDHNLGHFSLSTGRSAEHLNLIQPDEIKQLAIAKKFDAPALRLAFARAQKELRGEMQKLDAIARQLKELKEQVPMALVLQEKSNGNPEVELRRRGEFLNRGEKVSAGTPQFLPNRDRESKQDRLALAKWLVSPDNPLTPRVQVNRFWQTFFGTGLVETSEDFGLQGSRPTHPQLLDFLASEFVKSGWNVKAIQRMILTSRTYKQSSVPTAELLERDPQNRLLARGPRFRMEAEAIRDTVLTASGLLNPKIGGPSVMPYQPEGVWNSPYSGEYWDEAKDSRRYRRGIYTFWKRTAPYPLFEVFDATSREVCTTRRINTNTPLQALALLNDETTMEAAKAMGREMVKMKDPIEYAFRASTSVKPTAKQMTTLRQLAQTLERQYQAKPVEAAKFGGVKPAVMTMLAHTILNLDQTINRN